MINLSFSLSSKHFIVCEKLTCGRTGCLCCISLMYLCIHQVFFIFLGNFGVLSAIWLCILYGYINFFFLSMTTINSGYLHLFCFHFNLCVCVYVCIVYTHLHVSKKSNYIVYWLTVSYSAVALHTLFTAVCHWFIFVIIVANVGNSYECQLQCTLKLHRPTMAIVVNKGIFFCVSNFMEFEFLCTLHVISYGLTAHIIQRK